MPADGWSKQTRQDAPMDFKLQDDVENFVSSRHDRLQKSAESDSESIPSADEPEAVEQEVLPFDASDSDSDSDEDGSGSDASGQGDVEDRKDWGSRKHVWYGGDTHDYEIMADGERETALREEEEEAVHMQTEALSSLRAEDFRDELDGGSSSDDLAADSLEKSVRAPEVVAKTPTSLDAIAAAAPEVPLLAAEVVAYERKLKDLRESVDRYESHAVLFHLYSSFICNVAFYFSLRTDPQVRGIDFRKHPVMARIVRIRALLEKAVDLPLGPDVSKSHITNADADAGGSDDEVIFVKDSAEGAAEVDVQKENKGDKKKKKKNRKKMKNRVLEKVHANGTDRTLVAPNDGGDDDDVNELIREPNDVAVDVDKDSRKRRKLNQLVGAMEGERKNKESRRMVSADIDHQPEKQGMPSFTPVVTDGRTDDNDEAVDPRDTAEGDDENFDDDDDVTDRMLAKKEKRDARKARRAAELAKPHVYRFKDDVKEDGRRKASSQIVKNRGLTRYRPRDKKTPRTKNRLAYQKAIKKRKSVARDYAGNIPPNYSGESTGINMSAKKGSKLSTV